MRCKDWPALYAAMNGDPARKSIKRAIETYRRHMATCAVCHAQVEADFAWARQCSGLAPVESYEPQIQEEAYNAK